MKLFSERRPAAVAIVGTVVLVLAFGVALFSGRLPLISGGTGYTAYFAESAGLTTKSEVRVAGVRVGRVTSVRLEGTKVAVGFTVDGAWVGDKSTAAIKLKTLLGQKYLQVEPDGERPLADGGTIPLDRTTVPFDVDAATEQLTTTSEQIDQEQLAAGFRSLTDAFRDTPADVRRAVDGLSRLATTISSRDDEVASLMRGMKNVTGSVAGVDKEVQRLLADGDLVLAELDNRRQALSELLQGTRDLAHQLAGLVKENQARLAPALARLDEVTGILVDQRKHIEDALRLLAPYYRNVGGATGAGHWIDGYLCGLFDDKGRPVLDAKARRSCNPKEWSR